MLLASLRHFSPMKQKPEASGGGTKAPFLKDIGKTHGQWGKSRRKIFLLQVEGKKTTMDPESCIYAQ